MSRRVAAPTARQRTGRRGEEIAARYLTELGWTILERNWRPGAGLRGELDIIALDPEGSQGSGTLVVVEVKTRRSETAGPPAEAVTAIKLARLRALALAWAAAHGTDASCGSCTEAEAAQSPPSPATGPGARGARGLRLDVVSVRLRPGRPAAVRHHRGVGL